MIFHSIRWRILAWNFALLAATAAVLLFAFYGHEKRSWLQEMDLRLRREMTRGMGAVGEVVPGVAGPRGPAAPLARPNGKSAPRGDSPEQRATKARQALAEIAEAGVWVQAVDIEAKPLYRSPDAPTEVTLITQALAELAEPPEDGPARPQDLMVSLPGHRVLLHRPPGRNLVMFGASTAQLDANLAALARSLALAGFAVVFVGCGIGWLLAGRSLRPIDRIAADAEGIAAGDYGRKIDVDDTESELGRLAVVLNETFGRMNAAREHMAQFTADASHELRTPLTVILSDSQGALRQERTPEEYRAALETVRQSAIRMKSISDALLELAQGDAGKPVVRDACDLADLADESVALLARVAAEHGAQLVPRLEGAPVLGDAARLGRLILNLTINAILHNESGVTVTVSTGVFDGWAELRVADDGRGIPAENLDRIFERFRRVDASRSRHTGGAGLGLAIVKQTAEAHGGTVAVTSEVGKGTVFVVRLPKA
jgi:two-component system, OmpR family, sensor kinase